MKKIGPWRKENAAERARLSYPQRAPSTRAAARFLGRNSLSVCTIMTVGPPRNSERHTGKTFCKSHEIQVPTSTLSSVSRPTTNSIHNCICSGACSQTGKVGSGQPHPYQTRFEKSPSSGSFHSRSSSPAHENTEKRRVLLST